MSEKIKILCVVGPTASGKTSLSVELAKALKGEIINADSMQIYKGISIASAAPTEDEKQGVPHHLFEFLSPDNNFTVADYVELAHKTIADVVSRNKLPVIVGGTGLYINSLIDNVKFLGDAANIELRESLAKESEQVGSEEMYKRLVSLDPEAAKKIHPNDARRIIRALELSLSGGLSKTEQNELSKKEASPYDVTLIGITYEDREKLYERINLRVDLMLENGLLEEAKNAYDNAISGGAVQAIGHKEFFGFFEGKITLEEATENLKRATRRYAKRQLTWFNREQRINWIYADNQTDVVQTALAITERKE